MNSVLGNSPAIAAVREKISHLSSFDTVGAAHVPTILIVGETGTGKGLIARAIHETGPRAGGPFIDVNCAAIPENLLEAELFGFEAGAFTDAKRAKQGLFEAASKGTLFLDEIDALAIQLQAKLLKAIEEKRIRRVGGLSDHAVDVKIIAATQKDLNASVAEGRFRADLFHRLAVVVLELPRLRERGDDILLLANHYLSRFAETHAQPPRELTEDAKGWLLAYTWPGNIRELSHIMERVTLLHPAGPVDAALLKQLCMAGKKLSGSAAETRSDDESAQDDATNIRQALAATGGNVVRAAKMLGLSRNALRYRMRRYGIERPALKSAEIPIEFLHAPSTGAPAGLLSEVREGGKPSPNTAPEPAATPNLPAFIGREKEMEFLKLVLQTALQGHGGIVCISGPAGVGKTRLVRELRRTTDNQPCLWLEGCFNRAGNHPYQAWVQVLRKYLDQRNRLSLPKITAAHARQLAKLVPEFQNDATREATSLSADPQTERILLFDSLTSFLSELSRKMPLVIFLDDLHWAPSIDYLHYLARNIEDLKVLVIATYRPDELRHNVDLWKTVMALVREQTFQSLTLTPFDRHEIERLVFARIGGAAAPSFVEALHQKTQGNAFFIEEILRLLHEEKAVMPSQEGWTLHEAVSPRTPDSVKAVVYERLELLGKDIENFLTLASVMGREFTPQLLFSLTEGGKDLPELLDRAEAAGIIVAQDTEGEEKYSFAHDLIQEALYERLGTARKRQLHRQIGLEMERCYAADSSEHYEALAHHFLEANAREEALHYAIKAGEKAEKTSSWEQAATHFETAIRLMAPDKHNLRHRAHLLERHGDLHALLGRTNLDQLHQALEIFKTTGEKEKASRMHRLIGIAWTSGTAGRVDLEKAIEHFQAAAALLKGEPPSTEKAFAHSYVAFGLLRGRLDLAIARSESEEAATMADRVGDNDAKARAYTELGVVHAFLGDLKPAEEYAEKSWKASINSSDPWMSARASLYPITFWPWRNERRWLEHWVARAMEYRERSAVTRYDLTIYSLAALFKALMGEPEEARQALARAEHAGSARAYFTPYWLHYPAMAYAVLGDWERAKELFAQGLRTSNEGHLQSNIPEVTHYARLLFSTGDMEHVGKVLSAGYQLARESASRVQQLNLLSVTVEYNVRCGLLAPAEEDLTQAKALFMQLNDWKGLAAPLFTAEGVLRAAYEQWELAHQAFRLAKENEQTHGFTYNEAGILVRWSEVYRKLPGSENRHHAESLLRDALSIYERCSATMDIVRTKEALASVS